MTDYTVTTFTADGRMAADAGPKGQRADTMTAYIITADAAITPRYCIATDYTRANGSKSWGVFDTHAKKFIEGGFFSKVAARAAASAHNDVVVAAEAVR